MFDYVMYDRALFQMNTWPDLVITPIHGRQFCEATFAKRQLYTSKKEFEKDAIAEYGHVTNALLMLRLVHRVLRICISKKKILISKKF